MTGSHTTIKKNPSDVVTDAELAQLNRALASAVANDAGIVEMDAECAQLMVNELIRRREHDLDQGGTASELSGDDLKVLVNGYIDDHKGEWVSELEIATAMGLPPSLRSMRVIREALRQLDMEYVGMDQWREPRELD